jgi:hypothetical protein
MATTMARLSAGARKASARMRDTTRLSGRYLWEGVAVAARDIDPQEYVVENA